MKANELRASARESLKGKWGKAALLTLVYMILVFIISFLLGLIPVIGQIVNTVISPALTFGFLVSLIKLSRGENPTNIEFLSNGFNSLGKLWKIVFRTFLKLLLPLAIVFISGFLMGMGSEGNILLVLLGAILYIVGLVYMIVKALLYSLTSYILYDEPNLTAKEIVEKSETLMKGNRLSLFWLELTFFGWAILTAFTFGIGYFWLLPYMQIAFVKFYEKLTASKNPVTGTDYDSLA